MFWSVWSHVIRLPSFIKPGRHYACWSSLGRKLVKRYSPVSQVAGEVSDQSSESEEVTWLMRQPSMSDIETDKYVHNCSTYSVII